MNAERKRRSPFVGCIPRRLEIEDRPGSIKEITDTIRHYGGRMVSILTSYNMAANGLRRVYIRMCGIDRFKLPRLRDAMAQKSNLLYMIDHLDKGRPVSDR